MKILLKSAAVILACICFIRAWVGYYEEHESPRGDNISSKFTPGMTVEQMVAVFPTDFLVARIGGLMRLNRFELLDTHLRARKDWPLLIQAWTVYIQESGQSDAGAYCLRGSASMAAGDFTHGYADTRKSCHLGTTECCAELKKLPPEKVTAFESEDKRVSESAPACELPLSSFSIFGPVTEGKFKLRSYAPQAVSQTQLQEVSRSEFQDLISREYKNREWSIVFTHLTATPRHLS